MQIPFWPSFQGIRHIEFGLNRVLDLLERLDNPHQNLPPTIHFAGTNGKGSTLNFLYQILKSKDFKVHCYTSPHLEEFNERIVISNNQIDDEALNKCLKTCQEQSEIHPKIPVTFFEGITVAAFLAFSQVQADFLLLETGLGGRLDATNVVDKVLASIITPISLDHIEYLGESLEEITPEKAGIIKKDCPVIIGNQDPKALKILKEKAAQKNSQTIIFNEDFKISKHDTNFDYITKSQTLNFPNPSMFGSHQIDNLALAIAASEFLVPGLGTWFANQVPKPGTDWPARLQKIHLKDTISELYIDGSHNVAGANTVLEFLRSKQDRKIIVIYSTLQDKNHQSFLKIIADEIDDLIITTIPNEPKSLEPELIQETAKALNLKSQIISNSDILSYIDSKVSSFAKSTANKPTTFLITGSLYSAGYFLKETKSNIQQKQ